MLENQAQQKTRPLFYQFLDFLYLVEVIDEAALVVQIQA